ncbi:MAG TPA: ATP-binding protein [Gillisia sp.]|nr:ATP-binding protein [Gillisia sp.]
MPSTISTEEKLQERIKELTCLYDISLCLSAHKDSFEDTLTQIGEIVKQAWRFSEAAIVEIKLSHYYQITSELPENTIFQISSILSAGNDVGYIKVHYPAGKFSEKHFMEEEQKLLDKVCFELGSFYEKELNKEKEELLRRSAQRVDRLAILGEITAGIAHELNTPLGNILGFAELIANRTRDEQIKTDVSRIIKSAIFSREVVKKLMFFACEMPQNMDLIKIGPVVSQVLSLLGPNFKKAGINHSFHIQDKDLTARLDSIQLSQVLFNILINALYVSPKGSTIDVNIPVNDTHFFIEVSDEGPGIPEELKSKIFEPFFTTKPLGEGSGLGLSVVHGIIKSHKGDIKAIDRKSGGTTFQIKLPLTA